VRRLGKILLGLVVAVAVVFVLFEFVFPWVDRTLITDPVLDPGPTQTTS
jgi:hypothetical protein